MGGKGHKSEQATARRLEKARREGQFPTTKQFVPAVQFLAFTAMVARWGPEWLAGARECTRFVIGRAFDADLHISDLVGISRSMLLRMFLPLVFASGVLITVSLCAQMIVTRFAFTIKKLSPDFNRLIPFSRL